MSRHWPDALNNLEDTAEADRLVDEYIDIEGVTPPANLTTPAELDAFWAGVAAARRAR